MRSTLLTLAVLAASKDVSLDISPDPNGLPGGKVLQGLLSGLMFYGVLAAAAGMLFGLVAWGAGSKLHNHDWASAGKRALLVGAGVAFGVAATAALVEFFFAKGSQV